jgi:LCCL domain
MGSNKDFDMRLALSVMFFGLACALTALIAAPPAALAQGALPLCDSFPVGADAYECQCPPQDQTYGAVWGSGPYTADSNICVAAAHAGVIGPQGGGVVAYAFAGQDSYEGSTANGVQTSTWGSYDASFMFEPAEDLPMTPVKTGQVRACAGFPDNLDMLTCSCTGPATAKGTFWGNDPYTIDSDICIAARHSGIITADGGTVTAIRVMGLDAYTSSLNNGVQSEPSGPFEGSMVFDRN